MRILQSMLTAIVTAPTRLGVVGWNKFAELDRNDPESLVEAVLSATGEVSSLVYAATLLDNIEAMADDELLPLLTHIATSHDLDADALSAAAARYAKDRDANGLASIASLAEPRWVELFRLTVPSPFPSGPPRNSAVRAPRHCQDETVPPGHSASHRRDRTL